MSLLEIEEEPAAAPADLIAAEIRQFGPRAAFERLIAQNDALIGAPNLENGRAITRARSAIYMGLVGEWAREQQELAGYTRPFAVVAVGGTGRGEMCPCSDSDFAFLFDDALEGNSFLREMQEQVIHSDVFRQRCGFGFELYPFNFEDIQKLDMKQLNAFVDLQPVYDPQGLGAAFREGIRSTYDPFEHFLHIHALMREQEELGAYVCERLDDFDIKRDALRVFLAGVWTLAGKGFLHTAEICRDFVEPRDLAAYDFLLRVRSYVHLHGGRKSRKCAPGRHAEDRIGFDELLAFGNLPGPEVDERTRFDFAQHVLARLLSARRRVVRFTGDVISGELRRGRPIHAGSPLVYGAAGLRHATAQACETPVARSRAALSLLLAAQHYGVAVDAAEAGGTFQNAGDWLVPVPELSALFYESRGSLASSLEFFSCLDGAEDRLFPGYAKFAASIDGRVLAERKALRGELERQKMRALEELAQQGNAALAAAFSRDDLANPTRGISVAVEAALLDEDHLAAVKLALKTKRLPVTADDVAVRADETRPLHDRFSTGLSGIPVAEYYQLLADANFSAETLRVTQFLVENRRAFKVLAANGMSDGPSVRQLAKLCGSEARLRALFVFSCADRAVWESAAVDPARWFNTRELYFKARMLFLPDVNPSPLSLAAGYSPEQLEVMRDFGADFYAGVYRHYANRFGSQLVRLAQEPEFTKPKVSVIHEGPSTIVGVAARDFRGLAACISGALRQCGLAVRQAHLFSAAQYGLALDFFHLAPANEPPPADLSAALEEAIQRRLYIGADDEPQLAAGASPWELEEWRPGLYRLRAKTSDDVGALMHALAYVVFRHLGGNVFGLTAHHGRTGAWVSVYHSLPYGRSVEEARAILLRYDPCDRPPYVP